MSQYTIHSDGSAALGGYASCACIIENHEGRIVAKLCALLPEVSPLHAEICGGLLGLEYLQKLCVSDRVEVSWCCDSLVLLQGFESGRPEFATLRRAASSFELTTRHVFAHSGERRNEACDRACRWVRLRGARMLSEQGEGEIGLGKGQIRWSLRDLRTAAEGRFQ